VLRVSPDVHAAVATAAEVHGKSINQRASDVLDKAADI
jgi:predicted HicB family RNase H-like nuclease